MPVLNSFTSFSTPTLRFILGGLSDYVTISRNLPRRYPSLLTAHSLSQLFIRRRCRVAFARAVINHGPAEQLWVGQDFFGDQNIMHGSLKWFVHSQ